MSLLSPLVLVLAASSPAAAQQPTPPAAVAAPPRAAPGPNSTTLCHFQTGPLAGQTKDFAKVAGMKPFARGAPCTDGHNSVGVAVAMADRAGPSPSAADRAGADAASVGASVGYRCRFTTGPRAGETGAFRAPARGVPRAGAICTDGRGSRGQFVR